MSEKTSDYSTLHMVTAVCTDRARALCSAPCYLTWLTIIEDRKAAVFHRFLANSDSTNGNDSGPI